MEHAFQGHSGSVEFIHESEYEIDLEISAFLILNIFFVGFSPIVFLHRVVQLPQNYQSVFSLRNHALLDGSLIQYSAHLYFWQLLPIWLQSSISYPLFRINNMVTRRHFGSESAGAKMLSNVNKRSKPTLPKLPLPINFKNSKSHGFALKEIVRTITSNISNLHYHCNESHSKKSCWVKPYYAPLS